MNNIVNQVAYLPTSRNFPAEINQLTVEINKSYVDIASAVNGRTISIFPANRPAINGESWFLNNQRQQGFREVYRITAFTELVTGIHINDVFSFTKIYGIGFNGTNFFPIPFVSTTITDQIGIFVGPGSVAGIYSVTFSVGGTAPSITNNFAIIILEWISQV